MKHFSEKILSTLLAIIFTIGICSPAFFSITASAALAESGQCGKDVFWGFNSQTGTLTISGTGSMYNYSSSNRSPFYNASDILKLVIDFGIDSIGSYMFYSCHKLSSVSIADSVESIEAYAFSNCDAIKSLVIPNSVTEINDYAFCECTSIKTLTLSNKLSTLGKNAFTHCSALTTFNLPNSLRTIGDSCFSNCFDLLYGQNKLIIPEGVESIGSNCFVSSSCITSISLPSTLISLGNSALSASNVRTISVSPDNKYFSTDSNDVLYDKYKTKLIQYPKGNTRTSYTIPDGVQEIGYDAISSTYLQTIIMPDSVTKTSKYSIRCKNLKNLKISANLSEIGEYGFSSCESLTSLELPNTVTSIGASAFHGCRSLTSIRIPGNIKTISNYCFASCDKLSSAVLESGVETIEECAFYDCTSLAEITIPKSVTSIYDADAIHKSSKLTINCYDNSYAHSFAELNKINYRLINEYNGVCGEGAFWSYDKDTHTLNIFGTGAVDFAEKYGWNSYKNDIMYINIVENITDIPANIFISLPSLLQVNLGNNIKKIGENAFVNCPKLSLIYVSSDATIIPENAFSALSPNLTIVCKNNPNVSTFKEKISANVINVSFNEETGTLLFGGILTVYKNLDYSFIADLISEFKNIKYLHFNKLIFNEVKANYIIIDDSSIHTDINSEHLTFNDLYINLKVINESGVQEITFDEMLNLLKNGNYDAFKMEIEHSGGKESESFFQKILNFGESLITDALKAIRHIINFLFGKK